MERIVVFEVFDRERMPESVVLLRRAGDHVLKIRREDRDLMPEFTKSIAHLRDLKTMRFLRGETPMIDVGDAHRGSIQ